MTATKRGTGGKIFSSRKAAAKHTIFLHTFLTFLDHSQYHRSFAMVPPQLPSIFKLQLSQFLQPLRLFRAHLFNTYEAHAYTLKQNTLTNSLAGLPQIPQEVRGFSIFPFSLHSADGRPPKTLHLRPFCPQPDHKPITRFSAISQYALSSKTRLKRSLKLAASHAR